MKFTPLFIFLLISFSLKSQTIFFSSSPKENIEERLLKALKSENDTIVFIKSKKKFMLGPMRLVGISNKTILFEKGAEIEAKKGAFPHKQDMLFKLIDCSDIKFSGNNNLFLMNKSEYIDGEWRHVFKLRGCSNITIENLILSNSGGDGISITNSIKKEYSENIIVNNIKSTNNKRQGISIISGKDIHITNSEFTDTVGTAPGAGVDIEPNNEHNIIQNVCFENCYFARNFYAGIGIALVHQTSKSRPVSIVFKDCIIENNFSKENNRIPAEIIIKTHKTDPVKGLVVFERCEIKNSNWGMLYAKKNVNSFDLVFKDCKASEIIGNKVSPAIFLEVAHYRKSADFGGIEFDNLNLKYNSDAPVIGIQGSKFAYYNNLKDVKGKINFEGKPDEIYRLKNYDLKDNINVDLKITQK